MCLLTGRAESNVNSNIFPFYNNRISPTQILLNEATQSHIYTLYKRLQII